MPYINGEQGRPGSQESRAGSCAIYLGSIARVFCTMPILTAAAILRRALEDPDCFISAPGVYDGVSARIALSVGFDALYMVGHSSILIP